MILSDENNLYIEHGTMPKIIKQIGIEHAGLYLTIKAFEFENPNGIDEIKLLKSSSDGVEENKRVLESLIEKGYAERTKDGLIKATIKRFE